MPRRFKHPAEFLQEQEAAIRDSFLADDLLDVERRRRGYIALYFRARELAEDENTRNDDTMEKYMEVFNHLIALAAEAHARKLGHFEPALDVSQLDKIAQYLDIWVDEE